MFHSTDHQHLRWKETHCQARSVPKLLTEGCYGNGTTVVEGEPTCMDEAFNVLFYSAQPGSGHVKQD